MSAPDQRRFAIAVSFPNEHRPFVRNVVKRLAEVLGRDRVFYDDWYESELLGLDGDLKLRRYYREQSELVVPFFSEHYRKDWCQIEWSAIRSMLKDRRAEDAVIPVEMDGTRIEGWEGIDFAIRKGRRTGKQIADLLIEAYRLRHPETQPQPTPASSSVSASSSPPLPVSSPDSVPRIRWTDELSTYGDGWAGRDAELRVLDDAWSSGARVAVFHAEGGVGKTRLLVEWLRRLRDAGWPGAGSVFVHSFYSQGNDERRYASADLFFEVELPWFGYQGERITDARQRGQTLARLVIERRGLLILDGLEPLQHPPAFDSGRLRDPGIEQLLLSLAASGAAGSWNPAGSWSPGFSRSAPPEGGTPTGLCIVTSRQPVTELLDRGGAAVVQQPLDRLDHAAGAALLRQLDVRGTDAELFKAVDEYSGHAYSLMLLGTYLRDATTDHDIRRRSEIPLLDEDREHRSHADRLFGAYERHLKPDSPEVAVLRLLGLFDRAADRELINVLAESRDDAFDPVSAPLRDLNDAGWNRVLHRLEKLRLIVLPPDASFIDSHPLLREYFAESLRRPNQAERRSGSTSEKGEAAVEGAPAGTAQSLVRPTSPAFTAAHSRLFDHLCEATSHQPDTLDGLLPL
jgi:hypothetical protein